MAISASIEQSLPVLFYRLTPASAGTLTAILAPATAVPVNVDTLDHLVKLIQREPLTLVFVGITDPVRDQDSLNALLMAIDTRSTLLVAVVDKRQHNSLLQQLSDNFDVSAAQFADLLCEPAPVAEWSMRCQLYVALQQQRAMATAQQASLDYCQSYRDTLLAGVQEGVVQTCSAGRILDVNPYAAAALGYAQDAILGEHLALLLCGPTSLDPTLDWLEHPAYQAFTLEPQFPAQVITLYRADGSPLQVSCQILLFDAQNQRQRLLLFQEMPSRLDEFRPGHVMRYDPVTGLASMALLKHFLLKAMARALRNDRRLAVVCVDLDDFHCINENFGYRLGNELLKSVGRRIKRSIRTGDLVSRLEDDTFLVVLDEIRRPDDACKLARQILDVVSQPHDLNGVSVIANASLGVALYPAGSIGIDELIKRALLARDTVKKQGKHGLHVYSEVLPASTPGSPHVH